MPSNASKSNKSSLKDKEAWKLRRDFADRLDNLIRENKTTADAVAKKTGISKGTLSNYINATTSPKALEIKKIAESLSTTCDYLLRGIKPENVSIHEKTGLSDEAIDILFKKKNSVKVLFFRDGEPCRISTTADQLSAALGGGNIKLTHIWQDYFTKTLDLLITHPDIVDDLASFLYADFANANQLIDKSNKTKLAVRREGQTLIEDIDVKDINMLYLMKAQAKLINIRTLHSIYSDKAESEIKKTMESHESEEV